MTKKKTKYKSAPLKSIHKMLKDLEAVGLVDKKSMEKFDKACLNKK